MKSLFVLLPLLAALSAHGGTTNSPNSPTKTGSALVERTVTPIALQTPAPGPTTNSLQSQFEAAARAQEGTVTFAPLKANEIQVGNLTYSGIVVQGVKTRKPWQLINPAAPPEYGTPEDNVTRGPIHRRVIGLKIFELRF
jgi:hypothetical protein